MSVFGGSPLPDNPRVVRPVFAACAVALGLTAACQPGPSDDEVLTFGEGGAESAALPEDCRDEPEREVEEGPMAPPVDVSPGDTGDDCFSLDVSDVASLIPNAPQGLSDLDADLLFLADCLDVDTPDGLRFVTGVALRSDDTGVNGGEDLRLPLSVRTLGFSLPSVPVGTTLLVAKVSEFQDRRVLRLVHTGSVRDDGRGGRVFETLGGLAELQMSGAMRIDGPGLYGLFRADAPLAFVSGQVTLGGQPVPGALVTGTAAPFMSFADEAGGYTIASLRGEAGFVGFDLETGAIGQVFLPVESGSALNPKTGEPGESPAGEDPVDGLDALNLVGADIKLAAPAAATPEPEPAVVVDNPNLDFESGSLTAWQAEGNVDVLASDLSRLFPESGERRYAFVSSGAGSVEDARSALVRTFDVPPEASELHVRYTFVSQEYPAWLESSFNDLFVIFRAGSTEFLVKESVQSNIDAWQDYFSPLGNVSESVAEVGDVHHRFGGRIEAREAVLPVSRCADGRPLRLVFAVTDIGDRIYDSAALIDAVWFE